MSALFNADFYLENNPDVARGVAAGLFTALQHFEQFGRFENRAPSAFFDPELYLSANPDVAAAIEAGNIESAFQHFVRNGLEEGRDPTLFFNSDFYLAANPDVANAIERGVFLSAFDHFLNFGLPEAREVTPFFDVAGYLDANPDIAAAVRSGQTTAFDHFVEFGFKEGRDLGNGVSLSSFSSDPTAQAAIQAGDFTALFARVAQVSPFIESFRPPAGYTVPSDQPIPTDFVPNEGDKLILPEGVSPPEGEQLPPAFEAESPEENESDPPADQEGGGGASNNAPTANDDTLAGIAENSGPLTIAAGLLLANDTDSEGGRLHLVSASSGAGGTVEIDVDAQTVTFTPQDEFNGIANFTYTVSDGVHVSNTALASFVVSDVAREAQLSDQAQDNIRGGENADLWTGSGVPSTGFQIVTAAPKEGVTIELGLKAYNNNPNGGAPEYDFEAGSTSTSGVYAFAEEAADSARYVYSIASLEGQTLTDLIDAGYVFKLRVDTDAGVDVSGLFFTLTPENQVSYAHDYNQDDELDNLSQDDSGYTWMPDGGTIQNAIQDDEGGYGIARGRSDEQDREYSEVENERNAQEPASERVQFFAEDYASVTQNVGTPRFFGATMDAGGKFDITLQAYGSDGTLIAENTIVLGIGENPAPESMVA